MQATWKDRHNAHVIAGEVLICGYDKTMADAVENHHETKDTSLNCCLDINLVLKPDKIVHKIQKIPFVGHILPNQDILPDPEKVQAISDMPYPEKVSNVRCLEARTDTRVSLSSGKPITLKLWPRSRKPLV